MKRLLTLSLVVSAAILAGCAAPPQQPVQLAPSTVTAKTVRIGVAMAALPKVDTHLPGADCLLCYAAAAMMNHSLTKHVVTLPPEGLPTIKAEIAQAITSKGGTAVVIPEDIKVDDLPKFSAQGSNLAGKDYTTLRQKYQVDKLVVISVSTLGAERLYSSYIPTSDPKGVFRGVGYMVDLTSNAYDWYLPVDVLKSSDGPWDEAPKFPGITNAYFQALDAGKESLLTPFK